MLHQVAPFHHPKERVGRHLSTKLNPNRFGPRERAAAIGCPRYDSIEPLRGGLHLERLGVIIQYIYSSWVVHI